MGILGRLFGRKSESGGQPAPAESPATAPTREVTDSIVWIGDTLYVHLRLGHRGLDRRPDLTRHPRGLGNREGLPLRARTAPSGRDGPLTGPQPSHALRGDPLRPGFVRIQSAATEGSAADVWGVVDDGYPPTPAPRGSSTTTAVGPERNAAQAS
jgi:hypothetical protein